MPVSNMPSQIGRCLRLLSRNTYANYTILGNLSTFGNVRVWQPNPITVFCDNPKSPKAVATVEDGRFSSEICLSANDVPSLQHVAAEALDYAIRLKAGDVQTVIYSPYQTQALGALGGAWALRDEVLIMSLAREDWAETNASGSETVTSVADLPAKKMAKFSPDKAKMGAKYRMVELNGEVVSYARAEPTIRNMSEICGVYTDPRFRRMGLARQVVADLCRDLMAEGTVPVYLVKRANVASIGLAESLGFRLETFFQVHRARKASIVSERASGGSTAAKSND